MHHARTAALTLFVTAASMAFGVRAQQPSPFDLQPSSFVQLQRSDALIVGICNRDRATLLEQLRLRRAALQSQRAHLEAVAGDGRLNGRDLAITVLMPGGLLYAAQRHDEIRRAQALLPQLHGSLERLAADLRRLGPRPAFSVDLRSPAANPLPP